MEFNQLVTDEIFPVLAGYGFSITEVSQHRLLFKSKAVELSISFDRRDQTGLLQAGQRDGYLYSLNDELIKDVFGSSIKIEQAGMEVFVHQVALFLKGDGSSILSGDRIKLEETKQCAELKARSYTAKLVQEQMLTQADSAWANGQYTEFVRLIDTLNKEDLPQSYQLKYKIAIRRV
jgi:hypothetical protein